MLGKRDPQLTFLDLGWRERIPKTHFAWQLEQFCTEAGITEEMFAELFSDRGRPSVSPVITIRAILYQLEKGLSDRELEEGSAFDDRVKLALGLSRDDKPLDAVTLCDHRERFLKSDIGWQLLYRTLTQAAGKGLLREDGLHITDSFLVEGAGATQDTITLIRKAIRQVLRFAEPLGIARMLAKRLQRNDYDSQAKPRIDWEDPEAKQRLVEELVLDARELVAAARRVPEPKDTGSHWQTFQSAVDLLERVAEQDVEQTPDGRIRIRHGVAKDRIISVTDPQMRHGRKTTAKKADGYKANIIVTGERGNIITNVTLAPANAADHEMAKEGVAKQVADGVPIRTLLGDTAYGGGDLRIELGGQGVDVVAKVMPAAGKGGRLSKEDFEINLEQAWVRCPQGHVTTAARPGKDAKGRTVKVFQFDAGVCAGCPLRKRCTTNPLGRTVTLHYHEDVLQRARAFQDTEAFKALYATRSHVERTIAHLTRHGGRTARYIGMVKTRFQLLMTAVRHNIKGVMGAGGKRVPATGDV